MWFLLTVLLASSSGCSYYKISTDREVTGSKLQAIPTGKRFMVHQGSNVWELRDVQVTEQELKGTLLTLPEELRDYVNPTVGSPIGYEYEQRHLALNLVHLHIYEYAILDENSVIIPAGAIKQIAFTKKDKGATVASHALPAFGIVASTYGVFYLVQRWLGSLRFK